MTLGVTRRELLRRVTSIEMSEWYAYYCVDPWGEERADLRQAITTAMIANVNRGKDDKAFTPEDFMPFTKKNKERSKPQDWKIQLALLKGAFG
jgi:hypothetical protein